MLPNGGTVLMKVRVLIVPAILAAFSLAVIWASLQLDESPPMIVGESMQPRVFPIFLMVVNLILIVILAVQWLKTPPKTVKLVDFVTWGSMLLMPVFFALTTWLDLFIGSAVVMFLLCLLWGERRLVVATATALLTPLLIFLLFNFVLEVRFPRGILMNWYYG